MKRCFNIDWLYNSEITKFENDRVLNIRHHDKSVVIELAEDGSKALLKINREDKLKLNVHVFPSKEGMPYVHDVCVPGRSSEEIQLQSLQDKIKQLASELVFGLVSYPLIENDAKVLSGDKKFVSLAKQVKHAFEESFERILNG